MVEALPEVVVDQQGDSLITIAGYDYLWTISDTITPVGFEQFLLPPESNTYYVKITSGLGCSAWSDPIEFWATGLEELTMLSFELYPNPNAGQFQVFVSAGQAGEYLVENHRPCREKPFYERHWENGPGSGPWTVSLPHVSAGVYLLVCGSATRAPASRKMVVRN